MCKTENNQPSPRQRILQPAATPLFSRPQLCNSQLQSAESATKSASHLSHFFSPCIPADSRFIGVIYLLLILILPAPHMFLTGTNFDFRLYSHFSFSKLGRYPLFAHTIRLISAPGTHSSSHLHFLHLELLSHLLIFYCCLVHFLLDLTGCTIRIRC